MNTEGEQLKNVMNKNAELHDQLWIAHSELNETRTTEANMLSSGEENVSITSLKTESAHMRQRMWYVILALTLFLFSKFILQSGKYATSPSSSVALTLIVVLLIIVTASSMKSIFSFGSILLPLLISSIVVLYISRYIVR